MTPSDQGAPQTDPLDDLDLPLFRLDRRGRIISMNAPARELVQLCPYLRDRISLLGARERGAAAEEGVCWVPLIRGGQVTGFLRLRARPAGTAGESDRGVAVAVDPDDRWQLLGGELEELKSRIVFFECDAEGRWVSGGDKLASAAGVPTGRSTLAEMLEPASRRRLEEHWQKILAGEAQRGIELEVQTGRPQLHTFRFSFFPLRGPDGRTVGVRGLARDVSLEYGLAYALEAADERFNVLFRESTDPVMVIGTDGTILAANPAFEKLTGVRVDELYTGEKGWKELVHPEDWSQLQAAVRECLDADSSVAVEYQLRAHDGSYVWIEQVHSVLHDESGRPRGVLAVGRDVTRRRRREMDLRRTAAETLSQHERAQELIVRMTRLFRDISELPQEFERYVEGICRLVHRMFGPLVVWVTDRDGESLSVVWRQDIPPPLEETEREAALRKLAKATMEEGLPFFHGRLSGSGLMEEPAVKRLGLSSLLAAPARDSSGRLRGVLLVADDQPRDFERAEIDLLTIAALHLAGRMQSAEEEDRRRVLEEHLIQAQKMDAVGMLAGGIAHDFNNILSGILGFASMLQARVEPGSDMARYLTLIEQSAGRAAELTRQLLSFSRKSHLEKRPVAIADVVEEVLSLVRPSVPRNVEVQVRTAGFQPRILGDRSQMVQVLLNLCINAVEAMKPYGGRLEIGVEVRELSLEERRLLQRPIAGRAVCITVADTGPGMDPEVRAHIFDPFFTTKEGGTGLGLSIVYGIVTNHGGDVVVESEEGRGTTFRVYLPEYVEKPAGRPAVTGADTVLVVDDEMIVRQMIAEILKASGYPVLEAGSGQAAVEQLWRHRDRIGLVILDLIMPGMDGVETFEQIREMAPGLPVVLTTGYARSDQCRRLMRRGPVELIKKPFKSSELVELVAAVLGRPAGKGG